MNRWQTYEDDQDTEYLQHEPTIARNTSVVFEQFPLCPADVRCNIDGVRVYALHGFPLLGHHLRQLGKDLTKLRNRRLDRLDGSRARLNITVL